MDAELKYRLNHAAPAERRGIYEYTNAGGTYSGYVIIVGGNHREYDKYVSGISLSACEVDSGAHGDELGIRLPDGREFWVHCGMVTYFRRDRLGELVHKVSKQTMRRINEGIKMELGLSQKLEIMPSADPDYEKMYKDLIKTIAGWGKENDEPVVKVKKRAIKKGEG
jgi:hypothetical protein